MKQIRQYSVDGFKGVDLTSQDVLVHQSRASYMRNFFLKNGALVKRSGWRELYRIEGERINGIFTFDDGSVKETLVHAGTGLYRVTKGSSGYTCTNITQTSSVEAAKVLALTDRRTSVFQNNGRLFIVGAGPLMAYGKWTEGGYELRKVRGCGEEYVPTTTININDETVENDIRSTLDEVNMLTPKRINRLVGKEGFDEVTGNKTWLLDASVDNDSPVCVTVEHWDFSELEPVKKEYVLRNSTDTGLKGALVYTDDSGEEIIGGSVEYGSERLHLSVECVPYAPGRDNITVEFEHTANVHTKNYFDSVFAGARYGTDGGSDRLFLSVEGTNLEIFSEPDNFFYFGDRNTVLVGSDQSAIKAFARLDDSTLAIFKEEYDEDAPIYYQSGYYETFYDDGGNISKMTAFFPVKAGSSGETCLSAHTLARLEGDLLMLSKNGVFGVHLTDNVSTAQRYTKERGRYIVGDLLKRRMSDACAAVHGGRYYLALGDEEGICYVADARMMCYPEYTVEKSYQYEWTVWDHVPARVFKALDDGNLYFGTKAGQVCVFDGAYTDREHDTEREVVAVWNSATLDLGGHEKGKTLMKMAISATGAQGMTFGYETTNKRKMLDVKGQSLFSFEAFSFDSLSFEGQINNYVVKIKEKDFSRIRFCIRGGSGRCLVFKMMALYKNNSKNKGVR